MAQHGIPSKDRGSESPVVDKRTEQHRRNSLYRLFRLFKCFLILFCSMMRQAIHRDLNLTRHGLLLLPYLGTVNFGDDGRTLFSYPSEEAEYNHLRKHCPHDADAMFRFQADLTRYAQLIRKTLLRTPPDPTSFKPRDIQELLFLAKAFWALGEKRDL